MKEVTRRKKWTSENQFKSRSVRWNRPSLCHVEVLYLFLLLLLLWCR